jgi:arsenate reductase
VSIPPPFFPPTYRSAAARMKMRLISSTPSRDKLKELIPAMGISVRVLLRQKGTPYK